jgi:hypothetical protein
VTSVGRGRLALPSPYFLRGLRAFHWSLEIPGRVVRWRRGYQNRVRMKKRKEGCRCPLMTRLARPDSDVGGFVN